MGRSLEEVVEHEVLVCRVLEVLVRSRNPKILMRHPAGASVVHRRGRQNRLALIDLCGT
jgi:hypothetical protein